MTTTVSKCCPIKLLDKTYDIKCPEPEIENLKQAAVNLNKHLMLNKKNFKQLDDFHNAILSALHMSHALLVCQKQQKNQRDNVKSFMKSLENPSTPVTESPFLDPITE